MRGTLGALGPRAVACGCARQLCWLWLWLWLCSLDACGRAEEHDDKMDESAAASDAKQDAAASSASSPSSSSSDAIARARSLFANRFCVLRSLCSPPHPLLCANRGCSVLFSCSEASLATCCCNRSCSCVALQRCSVVERRCSRALLRCCRLLRLSLRSGARTARAHAFQKSGTRGTCLRASAARAHSAVACGH